jgi:hypothetical protein
MNSSSWCASGMGAQAKKAADGGHGAVDAGGVDVQVRDEAQAVQAHGQDAVLLQVLDQRRRALARRAHQVDEQDVGLRRLDRPGRRCLAALRPARGQRVVLREALHVVVERVDAAAASTPAWRIAPPAILRMRRARAISSREPHSADPAGVPSPLLKQTETESNRPAMRRASASDRSPPAPACATAALNRRAPSRWAARPLPRAPARSPAAGRRTA